MTFEEIKGFKRVLKELGIYKSWLKERHETVLFNKLHSGYGKPIFGFRKDLFFRTIILDSFWWDTTDNPFLWSAIYEADYSNYKISELLKDEKKIKKIKEFIKPYLH